MYLQPDVQSPDSADYRFFQLEFTTNLLNEGHIVFAIVRNRKQVSKGFTRLVENERSTNLHVLEANIEDYASLVVRL